MEPKYFNMNGQAGAPPDDFSVNGQNWGFPTYNWDMMEKDNFSWWKKRFRKLEDYFDSFRIDHILGFFRIWEVPSEYVQDFAGISTLLCRLPRTKSNSTGLDFNEARLTYPSYQPRVPARIVWRSDGRSDRCVPGPVIIAAFSC
mgnify:CR=1 FL=1